jgi:hypothetical protein
VGADASWESVDATSTRDLRLKHECDVTDREIARSLSVTRSTIVLTPERDRGEARLVFPVTLGDSVLKAMLYSGHSRQQGARREAEPASMAFSPTLATRDASGRRRRRHSMARKAG